jgi:hypothetical protein
MLVALEQHVVDVGLEVIKAGNEEGEKERRSEDERKEGRTEGGKRKEGRKEGGKD